MTVARRFWNRGVSHVLGFSLMSVGLIALSLMRDTLVSAYGQEDEVSVLINQANGVDRKVRIEAVKKLGKVNDKRALETLIALLDAKIESAEEREEILYYAAESLGMLAWQDLIDERVLPRLDQLAATRPTVLYVERERLDRPTKLPKYPFHGTAQSAGNGIRMKKSERVVKAKIAGMEKDAKLAYLVDMSWKQPSGVASDFIYIPARDELKKLGIAGVEPTKAAIPLADKDSQYDMIKYFVDTYKQDKDQRCLDGLLALCESKYDGVQQQAVIRLSEYGNSDTSQALIKLLESKGMRNDAFTQITIESIGKMGGDKAIPFLKKLLFENEEELCTAALLGLVHVGQISVPVLIEATRSKSRVIAHKSVYALLEVNDNSEKTRQALKEYLDKYPDAGENLIQRIKQYLEK